MATTEETGISIIEDNTGGNYFRIQDTNFQGRRERYLDINGEYPANRTVNGRTVGISKNERQALTHFSNTD